MIPSQSLWRLICGFLKGLINVTANIRISLQECIKQGAQSKHHLVSSQVSNINTYWTQGHLGSEAIQIDESDFSHWDCGIPDLNKEQLGVSRS